MTYIWINPVTDSMYDSDVLNDFLGRHGYKRFYSSGDWLTIVKQKYKSVIEQSSHPVMDVRCPKVKELLGEIFMNTDMATPKTMSSEIMNFEFWNFEIANSEINHSNLVIPEIPPILIHCGIEGSEREDLDNEEKIITTPCQALADMGNALELKNTKFIPWNRFVEFVSNKAMSNECSSSLLGTQPKKSPIPPGFFNDLGLKTVSLTGEEEICEYFRKPMPADVRIVEMLFCKDGCHNGDGIRKYKNEK